MEEVAGSRRAGSRFGDFAFSLLAAALGLALLFATGRHLFGASSVDPPDRTVASVSAIAVVPAPRQPTRARTQSEGSAILGRSDVAAAQPIRARAVDPPRGFLRPLAPAINSAARAAISLKPAARAATSLKPAAKSVTSRQPTAKPATSLKRGASTKTSSLPGTSLRAALRGAASLPAAKASAHALQRPRAIFGVTNAVTTKVEPRARAIARSSPAAVVSHPREVPRRVARLVTSRPRPALGPTVNGARRPFSKVTPHQSGARDIRVVERARIVGRTHAARAPSVIEPPLGYDAQPALVLVPGAAQLELGEIAIPTIRSKRRH